MGTRLHVCALACALLAPLVLGCGGASQVVGGDAAGGAGDEEDRFESFTFQPPVLPFFAPPHVDGDREFDGNGPSMTVMVDLHVVDGDRVHATVQIEAVETSWDWSRAFGSADFLLYQAPDPIVSIDSPTHLEHHYRDTDHAWDVFELPEGESPVEKLTCIGDTMGREAGTETGCFVELHPVTVTLEAED